MNKVIFIILIAVGLSSLLYLTFKNKDSEQIRQETHYHAGFQVYKDNSLQDYSGFEYMNITPCGEHTDEELSPEEAQLEKGHLHDNIGDVVHVHSEGATWGDLFKNIKIEVNPNEIYVNGQLFESSIFDYPIYEYDSVVVFEGQNTNIEEKLKNAVTKEHIVEVESKSENCGS